MVTDGASVMTKMGKLCKPIHQICFAHAIHLAVCDVLYDPKTNDNVEILGNSPAELNEELHDHMLHDDDEICDPYDVDIILPILKHHLNFVINKVRIITRLFRKSPTKNDILQGYVKEIRNGKELKLILDCKTRVSSLLTMIERFLELKKPLSKALIDVSCSITIYEHEWEMLDDIHKCLKPVEIAVASLCSRDSTGCNKSVVPFDYQKYLS